MPPLRAHSQIEARLYLQVVPCEACSHGPWESSAPAPTGEGTWRFRATCTHCSAQREFEFALGPLAIPDGGAERINPTSDPSEIIDAGQWLSLHYLLMESAQDTEDRVGKRQLTSQAAQSLAEALKFYTADDELPPETAFFTESSRHAFADHPERFARQKLRDMRDRLPKAPTPPGTPDQPKTPWWKFWRRRQGN